MCFTCRTEGTVDRSKAVQLTISMNLDAAEKASEMPAQFELFQQLLQSDTDDYSVAHTASEPKGKKRPKVEAQVDADSDAAGTFTFPFVLILPHCSP